MLSCNFVADETRNFKVGWIHNPPIVTSGQLTFSSVIPEISHINFIARTFKEKNMNGKNRQTAIITQLKPQPGQSARQMECPRQMSRGKAQLLTAVARVNRFARSAVNEFLQLCRLVVVKPRLKWLTAFCLCSSFCPGIFAGNYVNYNASRMVPFYYGEGYARNAYEFWLDNSGQPSLLYLNGVVESSTAGGDYSISLPANTDASGIGIGIVDCGVDDSFADLAGTVSAGCLFLTGSQSGDYSDHIGHGTLIASVIAGKGTNVLGIVQNARLFVASAGSFYATPDMASGINWCVTNGASVINISWGTGGYSSQLAAACQLASQSNVVLVCAAVNSQVDYDTTTNYPPSFNLPNIITVTDLTSAGAIYGPGASGYGTNLIGAPGRNILGDVVGGAVQYSTGTSFATPMVVGAVALLQKQYPHQPAAFYVKCIKYGSMPLPTIYGSLNIAAALQVPIFSLSCLNINGMLQLTVNGQPGSIYDLQSSADLINWVSCGTMLGTDTLVRPAPAANQFFRLAL
jgi:hypothetical protein